MDDMALNKEDGKQLNSFGIQVCENLKFQIRSSYVYSRDGPLKGH